MSKEITTLNFVNIIQPEHSRTSCSDDDLQNGFYSNENFARCTRCVMLEVIKRGYLPKSHLLDADFSINKKLSKEELSQSSQEKKE